MKTFRTFFIITLIICVAGCSRKAVDSGESVENNKENVELQVNTKIVGAKTITETETPSAESVSNEDSNNAAEAVLQRSDISKELESEPSSKVKPTGFSSGQMQRVFLMADDALYIYVPYDGAYTLPSDAVLKGVATVVTKLPAAQYEMSCVGEETEIYYSEADKQWFFGNKNDARKLVPATEDDIKQATS